MKKYVFSLCVALAVGCGGSESDFRSDWPEGASRPWAGADYWANPLQDWAVQNGRLENVAAGGERNVFLLTREISEREGDLHLSVKMGRLGDGSWDEGFAGFRVGIRGSFDDYRDSAVRGFGMNAGVAADGRLFIGELTADAPKVEAGDVTLTLAAEPAGAEYAVTLAAGGESLTRNVPADWLAGGIALVSHSGEFDATPPAAQEVRETGWVGKANTKSGGTVQAWFDEFEVSGSKVDGFPERAYGPILFTMQTLDEGVMTMNVMMAPVDDGSKTVTLETEGEGGWSEAATAEIEADSRTAIFRLEDWDDSRDTPYRVRWEDATFEGTVRKNPSDKDEIVVAAFTGNNDLGFPHADIVRNVKVHDPDLLAYTGDNIYERVGEYGIVRDPVDTAILDYLRKWYIFGWEYRELLKDIPSVALPDDHDVYQGNIWGAGGRHATEYGQPGQDQGGFTMDAQFVHVVMRTQLGNLPEPYDPTPIEQGIAVGYTDLDVGGVSFAIIEDRKWKSAPKGLMPKAEIVNGWAQNPRWNAVRDGDVEGAVLLGQRQLDFLEAWAQDWSDGVWMKSVISQTIFNNLATLPDGVRTDAVTPGLKVNAPGEYAQGEAPVADHDSNGWPQTGRDEAVKRMSSGLAFHIAGDQHLGSSIQYGVDDYGDGSWAICVPSVANIWPRRWFPPNEGGNHQEGMPKYTGEYRDGFGNRMTVHAVSNPEANGIEPTALNHRAPGYGIIEFRRADRTIEFANWPRWVDASAADAKPYPGWPIEIDQLDNGMSAAPIELPEFVSENEDPVVQVVNEGTGEVVYTLRIQGKSFTPRVWERGRYVVREVAE